MKIENLKDLQGLIKLCQKLGIRTMKVGDLEFTLELKTPRRKSATNDMADIMERIKVPTYTPTVTADDKVEVDDIKTDGLTEEQLLYYSTRPEAGTETVEQ